MRGNPKQDGKRGGLPKHQEIGKTAQKKKAKKKEKNKDKNRRQAIDSSEVYLKTNLTRAPKFCNAN
jgi:hypothetical protein